MIFTEIDKSTMQTLATLVKFSSPIEKRKKAIIRTGQFLGVPKEDTLELIEEWDESDAIELNSEEEKRRFLSECFGYLQNNYLPRKSDTELYNHVIKKLQITTRSNN
ncbi:MAG: hypothetical protein JXR10_15015 [Cyclobacteriaceae bacterium]